MPNEPVFSATERVPANTSVLPEELKGKTPEEVAAYYQQRERERQPARTVTPPVQPARTPENTDYWVDPKKATADAIAATAVTKAEFNQVAASVQGSLIDAAERAVQAANPDYAEYKAEVDKIMATCDPWVRTDKSMWETALRYARGGRKVTPPATVIVSSGPERGAPPPPSGGTPQVPELTADEAYVADHLGISAAQYRDGKKNMENNKFPITVDNRGGRSR